MTTIASIQSTLSGLRNAFNTKYDKYLSSSKFNENIDFGIIDSVTTYATLTNNINTIEREIASATLSYNNALNTRSTLNNNLDSLINSNALNNGLYNTLTKQDDLLKNYNTFIDTNNVKELENIYNHIKNQNAFIKKQVTNIKMNDTIDKSKVDYLNESDNYYNTISVYLLIFYFICFVFLIYILIVVRNDMTIYYKSAILLFFLAYPFLLRIINTAFSNAWSFQDFSFFGDFFNWVKSIKFTALSGLKHS